MIYATLDVDWPQDPLYLELYDAARHWPTWFLCLICWAKRANERGRVLSPSGAPLDARSMARLVDGRSAPVDEWQGFLDHACQVGALRWDGDNSCYQVTHWSKWHRAPSDEPERTRERQQRCRDAKRQASEAGAPVAMQAQLPFEFFPSPCDGAEQIEQPVTACHECHETEQSIAKQSKEEQHHAHASVPASASRREEVSDDDAPSLSLTDRMKAIGVHGRIAERLAQARPELCEQALVRVEFAAAACRAAYVVAEVQRGGYGAAEPTQKGSGRPSFFASDRSMPKAPRGHEGKALAEERRRADEFRADSEVSGRVIAWFRALPAAQQVQLREQVRDLAVADGCPVRLIRWETELDHPIWRGYLRQLLQSIKARQRQEAA